MSDQGPAAVPDQQVCVTGNHQQSAAEEHPALTLQDFRQPFWRPSCFLRLMSHHIFMVLCSPPTTSIFSLQISSAQTQLTIHHPEMME